MNGIGVLLHRMAVGTATLPTAGEWMFTGLLAFSIGWMAWVVGFRSGFFEWKSPDLPPLGKVAIALSSIVFPALAEEWLFRALLIPHPSEHPTVGSTLFWCAFSLVVFVMHHPSKRLLPSRKRAPFNDPVFLVLATLLGAACTLAYVCTGSVWASAAIHWLYVASWLLLLGGYNKMTVDQKSSF